MDPCNGGDGGTGGGGRHVSNFPKCNPAGDALTEKKLKWITTDYSAALQEANTVMGGVTSSNVSAGGLATMFVQWSMWESGYNNPGLYAQHLAENNDFGQQQGFQGSVTCPANPVIPSNSKNACFAPGTTWAQELAGALSASYNGQSYLSALQAALAVPTGTTATDLQAIATNGWNGSSSYGAAISGISIQSLINCALANGYVAP
jgi:hypothetical protein